MSKEITTQSEKARLGAIGENLVVTQLMQHDWDAFNANCTIKNFKSIDIVCIDGSATDPLEPWKPNVTLIQVKTSLQSNIPTGFTVAQCLDKEYLEKNVMGPYVFVSANKNIENEYTFRYFVISRKMFIDLIHEAHKFYIYGYNREIKKDTKDNPEYINGIKGSSPAGLYIKWLEGKSDNATKNHGEFKNPLKGQSCENQWENIWHP